MGATLSMALVTTAKCPTLVVQNVEKDMRVANNRSATDYYYLITAIAIKSLKVRYKNSILGFMWSLLTPLLYLLIFTFVFSNVFPDIENYPLYVLTGLIFWTFFASATQQLGMTVVESSGVLKSINIPAIAYPAGSLLAQLINLALTLVPFSILMFFFGFRLSWETLWIFPIMILFGVFTYGVGLLICSFNVYFRDVGILWGVLIPAIFYSTPIAYSPRWIPDHYLWVLKFNPVYHFVIAFRTVLYSGNTPTLEQWLWVVGLTVFFFTIGYFTFKRLEPGFISNY